jgi:hypothetical protein
MMKINVNSMDELVEVCAGLVRQGITFEADSVTMVITCTGGY